jgi:hypothetical protein
MSQWNVKASTLFILGCISFLMLLIVVLPDVDLPDTAFHRGTAPVVVHAQANAPPAVVMVAPVVRFTASLESTLLTDWRGLTHSSDSNFRTILLRCIRC